MFKRIIDPAYHSDGMGRTGLDTDETQSIIKRLQTLYGKPSLGDLDAALLPLNDTMDRNQPFKVMMWEIEEVQLFLLSHPEYNMRPPDTALIDYSMIKINKTGIYSKALVCWNAKTETNRTIKEKSRNHTIAEYEKLLAEGGRMTLAQEDYGMAFHTREETDENASLVESIVEYAERSTVAKVKTSNLENRLFMMEMNVPPPSTSHKYYTPDMAHLTIA